MQTTRLSEAHQSEQGAERADGGELRKLDRPGVNEEIHQDLRRMGCPRVAVRASEPS
jgi:hypothetical protein